MLNREQISQIASALSLIRPAWSAGIGSLGAGPRLQSSPEQDFSPRRKRAEVPSVSLIGGRLYNN